MIAAALGGFLSGCACTLVLVAGWNWFYAPLSHRGSTLPCAQQVDRVRRNLSLRKG